MVLLLQEKVMRNGFNQFSIPYMNEITANQIGAASVFNGNTPLGFINYSFDAISNFLNQRPDEPRTGRPEDFEEVVINGRKVKRRKVTQIDQILTPPIAGGVNPASGIKKCDANSTFFDRLLGRCCVGEVVNGKCMLVSDGKDSIGDDPSKSGEKAEGLLKNPLGAVTELNTKIVVILIGLILLLGAIVSLR
ncbi:hypothetical protein L0244_10590 [bacterium]|nr:hypothetical protein [bacterium]